MNNIDFGKNVEVRENEPLYKHSSFRIGGNARYALFPKTCDELIYAVRTCKRNELEYVLVGNASNILFDDLGYSGAVIFTERMNSSKYIYKKGEVHIKVDCGKMLTELSSEAGKKHSLHGLEFAYGIPGTVGGAVYMNAGAYGGQMSDIVIETEYYDTIEDKISKYDFENHKFSYRHSIFHEHPEFIILSTTLRMSDDNSEDIFNVMMKNMTSRREKQPLEFPSAGSTFKRPEDNIFVGKLIQDSGLKGYSIGGAQISEKHAGFIINRGGATSKDVLDLIGYIRSVIMENYGIMLECEIIYIPYE